MVNALSDNARDLSEDLHWFAKVLDCRLKDYFASALKGNKGFELSALAPPELKDSHSFYAQFIQHYELTIAERLILLLAFIPHIRPQLLDLLWSKNEASERGFTEFGGMQSTVHGGFIPTGETANFIIAADDLRTRFELTGLFEGDHFFARHNILKLSSTSPDEPLLSGRILLSPEFLQRFTTGMERKPQFSSEFPARLIETKLVWESLILPAAILDQLDEIRQWILHGDKLLEDWEMASKLRPGFTALFYGPSGTGKTLSASLIGKQCERDVYKIDLSLIVSKYIGETEKNLAKVFDLAEHKNWILFFDEADALFGKRTKVDDSHDRYANQEISFLLQRIEEFNGVVILASNMKGNIDDAFLRRFHTVISFPMPKPDQRNRIWEKAFSPKSVLEESIDLARVAEKYDLSGGTIMNVVRYASLKTLSRHQNTIRLEDLEEGIRRELQKQGKTV